MGIHLKNSVPHAQIWGVGKKGRGFFWKQFKIVCLSQRCHLAKKGTIWLFKVAKCRLPGIIELNTRFYAE